MRKCHDTAWRRFLGYQLESPKSQTENRAVRLCRVKSTRHTEKAAECNPKREDICKTKRLLSKLKNSLTTQLQQNKYNFRSGPRTRIGTHPKKTNKWPAEVCQDVPCYQITTKAKYKHSDLELRTCDDVCH